MSQDDPKNRSSKQKQVFDDISEERRKQDEQWGGQDHDACHSLQEWTSYIQKQLNRLDRPYTWANDRSLLIKIAALAVAAVEALDAQNSEE